VIPRSIRLKGFLCYQDEQQIEFDGPSTLWMLSGSNGSGKSAIFDGLTYSLFGHHRGGNQQVLELINKDSDGLSVEFDFALDGKLYRAKRTAKRDARGGTKGSQQLYRFDTPTDKWIAIEGTNYKKEFEGWISEHIGLDYKTFTSSVLLLQGKAEKLLDSTPEGRREVLAGIVDLDRYERLFRVADDERKKQVGKIEDLSNRLIALPAVEPLELVEADNRITSAEEAREQSRAEVERWQRLEVQAQGWDELQGRLAMAREKCRKAEQVLADAAAIEKAVERLRELREVLPQMQVIVEQRGELHKSEEKTKELAKARKKIEEQQTQCKHALKQATDKRDSLKNLIAQDEARHRDVATGHRKAAVLLEKLKEYERHDADLEGVRRELTPLPPDPAAQVTVARAECDKLQGIAMAVQPLAHFASRREELRRALAAEKDATLRLQQVKERGEQRKKEVDDLRPRVEAAARAASQAADQAAEARTLLQQARDALKELTHLDGAKVCRHCGQALTAGHLKEEKRRRSAAATAAAGKQREADDALQKVREEEQGLRRQLDEGEKVLVEARLEYRESQTQLKQAKADSERLQSECTHAFGEIPGDFRRRISPVALPDWSTTKYPTAVEVDAVRAEASGLGAAQRVQRQAEKVQQDWTRLKEREAATLENLKRLQGELPRDRQSIRAEHTKLEADEKALEASLRAKRGELREVEGDVERLGKDRDQFHSVLVKADGDLKNEERLQQLARQTVERMLKQLPEAWQTIAEKAATRDLFQLNGEKADLERTGAEERGKELQQARLKLDDMRQSVIDLEGQQTAFPEEVRQGPERIRTSLAEAKKTDRQRDQELGDARQRRALLESRRAQREQISTDYLQAEADLKVKETLSKLLGKDRLQLYLVRQAERQVVEFANAVLDRLSGGQLYLRLSGEAGGEGGSSKALDLEAYNRQTGEKSMNVAFLSGSQKFRVAVSLALGIGQYASRQHRPIESVIIDEGFGCLDRQGRQVMIQELQNLRGQMRCILLVSHQEEFADAFNDGYHFELEDGATKVQRVQK
jgi:exonuclease SbcC